MRWRYAFTNRADRDLSALGVGERRRVFETLDRFAADPIGSGVDVQRVKGSREDWRLRVGRWRLLYRYDRKQRTILIIRVLPRNESTYGG